MTILTFKFALTCTLLGACSTANAHPLHHTAVSSYHYLASPYHVAVFTLLGLAALSLLVYYVGRAKGKVKRQPK